ncbi:IS3 family transposase [Gracilibacillus sp. D59]|uniref:IS3 family transposase n=1 Tax=Gracilibacillus sp. D59 TaxID=3457434 RepID=UPI003FCCDBA1
MSRKGYTIEFKRMVLEAYENKDFSLRGIYQKYGVHHTSLMDWKKSVDKYGWGGLNRASPKNKVYTKEEKLAAISDYLSKHFSLRDVIEKYDISSTSVLRKWIKDYNGHREIQGQSEGMSNTMTKGRKTTWQERIEIVQAALDNEKDYQKTAVTHQVSYQQVYQWVRKYENGGWDALKDQRGRSKTKEELTPEQKMKLEMRRIEKENERLRAEKCFFKKVRGDRKGAVLSRVRLDQHYIAIQQLHEEEGFAILLLCEIAGVARASYYKWLDRTPTEEDQFNEMLVEKMQNLHKQVDGIYGYRRMQMNLERQLGRPLNHKRIYRLMKITGIQAVIRRKKKRYPKSTPQHIADNLLNRKFTAAKPNEKWVTDVTEFKYGQSQKAYLSAILDLYDGSIVSYEISTSNNNPLVFNTLTQALKASPGAKPLLHSDRGFQYTSLGFKKIIDEAGMKHSMSRVGRCIDNGPIESFWGTLKCEKYYLHKNEYQTYEQLVQAIEEYIHFYNVERYQKRLNGLSPMECRNKAA